MFKRTKKNARRLLSFTMFMNIFSLAQILYVGCLYSKEIIKFTPWNICVLVVMFALWSFWIAATNAAYEIEYEIAAEERERAQR